MSKNVLFTLLFIFISFLWGWPSHPLFAATGTITISALVPEKTATSSFAYMAGGTFNFTNTNNTQVNFTIPANFYTENLQLQVFAYDKTTFESAKPPPSGKSFVGKVYDFNWLTTSAGSSVSALSAAPTIVLQYLASDVSGLDESALAPYRRGSSDTSWQSIPTFTIDTVSNKVTFSTANFSSFALFGAPPTTPTPTPTPATQGGGGGGGGGLTYFSPTYSPTYSLKPSISPINRVNFSGKTEPRSRIEVWENGQIITAATANADGSFNISVPGVSSGDHTFSLISENSQGKRISTSAFQLNLSRGNIVNVGNVSLFAAGKQAAGGQKPVSTAKAGSNKNGRASILSPQPSKIITSVRKTCGLSCRVVSKLKVVFINIFKRTIWPGFIIKDRGWW